jgi:RimJ/RimL family protein N-acetyltransferase
LIFPHTESRRIVLRPATSADQASFFQTRLRAGIESVRPASAPTAAVSKQFNAAFVVARRTDGETLGFSTLHKLDPAGHIRCGIYLDPQRARLGVGSEAVHLSINYAFAMFNVDKVIAQTTEASFDAFGVSTEGNEEKSILPDHLYFRGRLWDLHNFEIERHGWEDYVSKNLDGVLLPSLSWRAAPHQRFDES